MKPQKNNFSSCTILFLSIALLISCNDELKERKSAATIDIKNSCPLGLALVDSVDIFMKYIDKDNKEIIDAYVVKRIGINDKEMKFSAMLKESDKWRVEKVATKFGNILCRDLICDTLKSCINTEKFKDYLPVDSVQHVKVNCECL